METLTINGEVVMVSSLPDNMKPMATLYEYTIGQELEARKQLAMIESARAEIGQRITRSYAEYKEAVAAAQKEVLKGALDPVNLTPEQ